MRARRRNVLIDSSADAHPHRSSTTEQHSSRPLADTLRRPISPAPPKTVGPLRHTEPYGPNRPAAPPTMKGSIMDPLTFADVDSACRAGGATVLSSVTDLVPAAGSHAGIAPARYVTGNQGTYAYETRYIDDEAKSAVIVDSKASQLNRIEEAIALAIQEGDPALSRMPSIRVHYEGHPEYTSFDYQLPHRFTDGHIRFGTHEGKPVTEDPIYVDARNATTANATALLELSPVSLVLGSWDSTRRAHQARYRSCATGEIIGVLADQTESGRKPAPRGAARKDDLAPSVQLSEKDMLTLLKTQEDEMSSKTVEGIKKKAKAAKSGKTSASVLGLGSIPPSLDALGLVSCSTIIRSHVLSFSALRQIRFGSDNEANVACRSLLAALALHGIALADEELTLRANCDLREASGSRVALDGRRGTQREILPLTREVTGPLLGEAIDAAASKAGIHWDGQVFEVTGNPIILGGIETDADED